MVENHRPRLNSAIRSGSKDVQKFAKVSGIFFLYLLEFPIVEEYPFAMEALVDLNIAESNLLELASALRTLHEMEQPLALAFLRLDLRLAFDGELAL